MKLLYTLIILLLSCSTEPEDCVELWGGCYNIEDTDVLSFQSNQLTGEIPVELGYLINLTSLHLGDNNFTGAIPPWIGNLTHLTYLNLHNNQFTGQIPPEIGNLINLDFLHLEGNQLTGAIPPEVCALIENDLGDFNMGSNDNLIPCE